ncbi:hypothetical protein BX070DRAFT_225648 [Coemansia spiralis]|nr:hypothetical protein BX070DRAFT_225648 [Coemansia spiralis]
MVDKSTEDGLLSTLNHNNTDNLKNNFHTNSSNSVHTNDQQLLPTQTPPAAGATSVAAPSTSAVMDGSDRKQSARRYASINTIPPLQDCASSTHSALAAAAAPIANLASPTRPRQSLDERSSISSCESISERKANLPFTYSGVFSQNFWNDIDAVSRSKVQPADDLENSTVNFNTDSPYSAATARAADKRRIVGGTITNGHFSLHEASSALAHSNRSGNAFADEPSSDNESESMSDDDDSDSSESYEGLAVDDINETYNQDLPEYVSNRDPYAQKIYLDEEGITIEVVGMSYSSLGVWLYSIVGILSFGIIPLLCRWMPRWKIRWTMRHANLGEADFAVVIDEFGSLTVEPIQHKRYGGTLESIFGSLTRKGPLHEYNNDTVNNLSMFAHRYYRFVYHPYLEKFLPNACWMDSAWTRTPASMRSGISSDLRDLRRSIFGQNNIDIKEKPAGRLLVDEVLNPFYVFQAGSVVLWCLENYYYYAACILLISVSGIVETLVETRRNTRKIKEMAHFSCFVRILRDGAWRDSNSEELLPGDVFEVVSGMHILPCDAVLLEGDCIVNESMLTGESVPVAKVPVVPSVFGKMRLASSTFGSDIAKHVLFSGTKLVRVKRTSVGFGGNRWLDLEQKTLTGMPARATAMVLRTGFNTTKGALVRSILFPRPNKFKFYEDSFRFIGVLAMIAIIGFLASIGNFLRLGLTARVIAIRALDLVTVVVPPALPATMSIGVSFALSRLRRRHIYCISPTRINVCGKINVMCFDKTGTLTEEGLDVLGVCTMDYDTCRFKEIQEDPSQLLAASAAPPSAPSSAFSSVGSAFAMGLPGGLADLDRSSSMTSTPRRAADPSKISLVDGEFMFESTGWTLDETDDYTATHGSGGVEERALYSDTEPSTGQHNSGNTKPSKKAVPVPTVVRPPNSDRFTLDGIGNANVYELGIIRTFDFSAALRRQSARYNEVYVKGAPEAIRELCYSDTLPRDFDQVLLDYTNHGYRPLKMSWHKIQRLKRDNVEQDLIFMGLLIFENKLKPTTAPVLDELRGAKIRQIIVGRECRMVPEEMRVFETVPVAQTGFGGNSSRCGNEGAQSSSLDDVEDNMHVLDPFTLEPRRVMERQQQLYLSWLHNYTNVDMTLISRGNFFFRYMMDESHELTIGRMLMRGAIYARMSPDEKAELVERLQAIGYCTGFCGDAADVGLSLSEAEASVAAPFTSHSTDIQAALFMALYSIIQFTTVSMLYKFGGNLGDLQFLYIDLFIIIPLAVRIAPKRPTANLMSKKVLTSLFGQIIINSSIQAILFHLVKLSENYTPPVREDPTNPDSLLILSFENTALFLASSFQYVIVACSNMRNFGFVLTCVVLIVYTTFLVLWPTGWAMDMFELHTVVVWAIFNFALSSLGEWWLYILCTSYAKLATGKYRLDSNRYVAEDIEGNGSPSETIGGHEHHIGYTETGSGDLEEGRVQLTWEEIARKKEIKPFKQILRDMGIPAWY